MKRKNDPDYEVYTWVLEYILTRTIDQLRELTVTRLAAELNMSRAYLFHLFKTQKDISPGFYLKMIRLIQAAKLINDNPGIPVKEVSKRVGFDTVDYFIREFKKNYGTTPLKYRQLYREKGSGEANIFPWNSGSKGAGPVKVLEALIKKLWKVYYYALQRLKGWLKGRRQELNSFVPSLLHPKPLPGENGE